MYICMYVYVAYKANQASQETGRAKLKPRYFPFFQKKRRLNITFKGIFRTVDIFLLRVCLERWIFGYSQKFPLDILMNEDIHGNYRSDRV